MAGIARNDRRCILLENSKCLTVLASGSSSCGIIGIIIVRKVDIPHVLWGSARIFVRFEGPLERYEIVGATMRVMADGMKRDRYKPGVVPTAAPQQPLNSAALPSRARSILSLTGLVISPANVRWASHQRRSAALRGNSQEEIL
ncbi:hypothetical protein V1477_002197 [Vespula maculifrons]|uniref:Uncharacterized protein n=1 Tax=Vespula maculifrons TaxID=7453 RepID=A0ABD2CVZ8_VESMC